MGPTYSVIPLVLIIFLAYSEAGECDNGWTNYKDKFCIKIFPSLLPYQAAKCFCSSQGSEFFKASLIMIKDPEMQDLEKYYKHDGYNSSLWIGGKYHEDGFEYRWDDGQPFKYTNWQEDCPSNTMNSACVELRLLNEHDGTKAKSKWVDVSCEKLNLVMCQKPLSWSLQDAVQEIFRMRKLLESMDTELQKVSSRVVPIGSIYIEYYNKQSPRTLWPDLTWEDVTSSYAGLFFRASGGDSASWGEVQNSGAPRITEMSYEDKSTAWYPKTLSIPSNGWSELGSSGIRPFGNIGWWGEGIRFHTQGGEVRPKNQAIRIWQRTA